MAQGIREKKFSSEEVMYSVTERMALHNPRLNAVVDDYSDEAIAEAREADRILAAGEVVGELHGVPVTIKSNVDVEGKPTPNGLPAFADLIAPADSPVVSNLKKAGAIIIGRTNTPELSIRFTTDNPLHGRTLNPWHEDASPGDLPEVHPQLQQRASGQSITEMTSVVRSAVRLSTAVLRRSNPLLGVFLPGCHPRLLNVVCWPS